MDSRTRLAVGGAGTLAASVVVVSAVIAANALALADVPGHPVSAPRITLAPPQQPTASSSTAAVEPEQSQALDPTPEVGAEAVIVAVPAPAVVPEASLGVAEVVEQARFSGSWESVREWAQARGWSAERIEAWLAKLGEPSTVSMADPGQPEADPQRDSEQPSSDADRRGADASSTSSSSAAESMKTRSRVSPDRRDR